MTPAEGKVCYIFGHCHSADPLHSGELHDIQQYFNILEYSTAEPFFIGEHAVDAFHHHQRRPKAHPAHLAGFA